MTHQFREFAPREIFIFSDECELKSDIRNLQECYVHQVKRLRNINIFKRLKNCREKERQNRHLLSDVLHNLKVKRATSIEKCLQIRVEVADSDHPAQSTIWALVLHSYILQYPIILFADSQGLIRLRGCAG